MPDTPNLLLKPAVELPVPERFRAEHFNRMTDLLDVVLRRSLVAESASPTYVAANQFSVTGDLTARYVAGAMVRAESPTGTIVYGLVQSSAFGSVTTVTVDSNIFTDPIISLNYEQLASAPIPPNYQFDLSPEFVKLNGTFV